MELLVAARQAEELRQSQDLNTVDLERHAYQANDPFRFKVDREMVDHAKKAPVVHRLRRRSSTLSEYDPGKVEGDDPVRLVDNL